MRKYLSILIVLLIFIGCKKDSESSSVYIFHSVPGTNEGTLEINGELQDQNVNYGTLSDEFEVEIGEVIVNLISENATTNPIASFEGQINPDENLTILFSGMHEQSQQNSFTISRGMLPETDPGEAFVRFVQASPNGDSVGVELYEDTISQENLRTSFVLSYSDNTEYIEIPVELGRTSNYVVRINDSRENESFDNTFTIRNEEVISFIYYGNPSVISGFEIQGILENF